MLKPSHINAFLGAWTYSAVDFHANRFHQQEIEKELRMIATSILISAKEYQSANQELFSSKMLKELSVAKPQTENQFSSMSSGTWKQWVTEQRQEYSQRVKLAHLIRESECLSWPTPSVSDQEGSSQAHRVEWTKKSARLRKKDRPNVTFGAKLRDAVESWPTPTTAEGTKIGNQANYGQKGLSNHPEIVGKPTREKGVKSYPTPTARDWKGVYKTIIRKDGKSRMDNLPQVADFLHDQTNINTNGKSHALNPSWVEQLMDIPVGWTDLGYWGTE
jgi:hypothetical protein